jgi:hypothetical protein
MAHVLRVAAPDPEKPGEVHEAQQAQVNTPVVVLRVDWRTAGILGRSLCREPRLGQGLAGLEFPAKPTRVTLRSCLSGDAWPDGSRGVPAGKIQKPEGSLRDMFLLVGATRRKQLLRMDVAAAGG